MPVPLKQAIASAIEFATGVLGNRARDVQLEEVESSLGGELWRITLSMIRQDPALASAIMSGQGRQRDYKTFTVRKDTGEVTDMKIREFAGE